MNQKILRVASWKHQYWLAVESGINPAPQPGELDQAIAESNDVFKHDRTTSVARVCLGAQEGVLKRYNPRNWAHKFKRAFRRSRARRCWNMSYHFHRAGLNVAQPVLMYEKRLGPIRRDAYFLNRYLPGEELLGRLSTLD
ncbi:MAG: hypothetical protein HKN85_02745, partial [Gammaproteobacteria bacterium]|nr:hypothetical protein [Gammaproteobacteria bacterium]